MNIRAVIPNAVDTFFAFLADREAERQRIARVELHWLKPWRAAQYSWTRYLWETP